MLKSLEPYKKLHNAILYCITAEFFIQLIDAAYLTILLVYMAKVGYSDTISADFLGYRFLGVLLLSFPLGFYIKGRRIRPLFYMSAIFTPLLSLAVVYAVELKMDLAIYVGMFLLGLSILGLQVSMIPFIMRNVPSRRHTEAISLSYSTYSLGAIVSGVLIFTLSKINPNFFNEGTILKLISLLSLGSIFFVWKSSIKKEFYVPILKRSRYDLKDFDWGLIVKAMIPTTLIATGAGLAIPFIGLFFFKIHNIDSNTFAILSAITTVLVFVMTIYVPKIKDKLGYKTTVTGSQSTAVLFLAGLATSEFYAELGFAPIIAAICFLLRQPFMNIAAPMTSDLTMQYVGFRNREMVSALTAAIWSGSWFFSSKIFQILRENEVRYAYIFLVTAALYVVGIIWYHYLMSELESREVKKD